MALRIIERSQRTHRDRDKDWREPLRGSARFDWSCRPHGSCAYCAEGRQHKHKRREPIVERIDD